jgi:hypothetical protein
MWYRRAIDRPEPEPESVRMRMPEVGGHEQHEGAYKRGLIGPMSMPSPSTPIYIVCVHALHDGEESG